MNFGFLKRKKKGEGEFHEEVTSPLPEDLERFRTREPEPVIPPRESYQRPTDFFGEPEKKTENQDKIDLILQKLETIDVRLKLLEEKLGV
jgi:hypothetical protein